jgi:hypothetical protein
MSGYESREDRLKRYSEKFAGRENVALEARNSGQPVAAFNQALHDAASPEAKDALKPLLDALVLHID